MDATRFYVRPLNPPAGSCLCIRTSIVWIPRIRLLIPEITGEAVNKFPLRLLGHWERVETKTEEGRGRFFEYERSVSSEVLGERLRYIVRIFFFPLFLDLSGICCTRREYEVSELIIRYHDDQTGWYLIMVVESEL